MTSGMLKSEPLNSFGGSFEVQKKGLWIIVSHKWMTCFPANNLNRDRRAFSSCISKLIFHGRSVGVCPAGLEAAGWPWHIFAVFHVQEHNPTISGENSSEVIGL